MKKILLAGGLVGGATTAAYQGYKWSTITTTEDQTQGGIMNESMAVGAIGIGLTGATAYGAKKGYDYFTKENFKNSKALGRSAAIAGASAVDLTVSAASTAGKTAANITAGIAKTIDEKLLEVSDDSLMGKKLNKTGKILMAAIAVGSSVLGMNDAYDRSRSGENYDQKIVTNTPDFEDKDNPSLDNYWSRSAEAYGAGGDLVFALNRNRRG